MGTLLLLRQVGGAVALASAETVYRSGHDPARRDGHRRARRSASLGSLIAAAALLSLPRGAGRLPAPQFAMS